MEQQILELTRQFADLVQSMNERQITAPRRGPRLSSYDGAAKGLAARQWLMQIRGEVAASRLTGEAAVALASAYLQGTAATWFHFENSEHPFVEFEPTDDEGVRDETCDAATFTHRFSVAFIAPGCTASGFFTFVQSPDTSVETYLFQKASLAQAANIPFDEAFDHIVQGIHDVFAAVKLAVSHHASASVVALVADIDRAARMIGLDASKTPRELLRNGRAAGDYRFWDQGRIPLHTSQGRWNPGVRESRGPSGFVPTQMRRTGGPLETRRPFGDRRAADIPGAGGSSRSFQGTVSGQPVADDAAPAFRSDRQRARYVQPTCWGCGETGHYRRDCPRAPPSTEQETGPGRAQCSSSEDVPASTSSSKYIKDCLINGNTKVRGLVDTGCSSMLIRASMVNRLELRTILDPIPIFGTGDISRPATFALGRVTLSSLQVDEGYAENVEAMVVADDAIPEDLFVGRTFLDLPHLSLLRIGSEFFVGPTDSVLEKIQAARSVSLRATSEVELCPRTAAFVETRTEPNSAVIVRSAECDVVYHSNSDGFVRLPVENTSFQTVVVKERDLLGRCRLISEKEFRMPELPSASLSDVPAGNAAVSYANTIGCRRTIEPHEVLLGPSLTGEQREVLTKLINEFRDVFSFTLGELGCTDLIEADIEVEPGKSLPRSRPYRLAPEDRDFMENQIKEWRDAGIVSDTRSPFASPAFVVTRLIPGKTSKKRVVIDVRKLNDITVDLHWPIPNVEDEFMDLSNANYFAQLDFMQGFLQIPLAKKARKYTSFITPESSGEFNRMLFGFKNGPAIFNHLVSLVLGPMRRRRTCFYFFDDVLVVGEDFDALLRALREVFARLRAAGLTLNPEKCKFGFKDVTFMGLRIKEGRVSPTEDKIKAIAEFRTPTSATQVRQFLGLSGFFRRFIPGYAAIAAPLSALTSTKTEFAWGESQIAAFEKLKTIMSRPPVLALFNPAQRIELHTDASSIGLAGIMLQPDSEGRLRLVRCVSRKCNAAETSYHSSRLELLAIAFSLEKLRPFLIGRSFKLVTDCQALLCINTRTTRNPQMARWLALIQDFQFTVEHRAGSRMGHVDALSRNPSGEPDGEVDRVYCGATETMEVEEDFAWEEWIAERSSQPNEQQSPPITYLDEVRAIQQEDPRVRQRIDVLAKPDEERTSQEKALTESFELHNGLLYKEMNGTSLLVIPDGLRKSIVIRAHDLQGHFGVNRTLANILRKCWFPRLKRYVRDHITRCIPCLAHRRNSGRQPGLLNKIPTPDRPFDWIHADHVGPFPTTFSKKTHILVIVDRLTKFAYLEAVRDTSAKETIDAFDKFTSDWGIPAHLTTDRGSAFTSNAFKQHLARLDVAHHLISPRRAQGNGQVERVNGIITPLLAKLLHEKKVGKWDQLIKKVQLLLNTSVNTATGETATRLLCGFNPEVTDRFLGSVAHPSADRRDDPTELRRKAQARIQKSFDEAKKHYDRRHRAAEQLSSGDIVWFEAPPRAADGTSRKLDAIYRGPFVITRALGGDTYAVASVGSEHEYVATAHISQLRLFGNSVPECTEPVHNSENPSHAVDSSNPDILDSLGGAEQLLTDSEAFADPIPRPAPSSSSETVIPQETEKDVTTAQRRSSRKKKKPVIFDPSA